MTENETIDTNRQKILNYGGAPPLGADAAMKLLGVTSFLELRQLRWRGKLLGLSVSEWQPSSDEHKILYPRWQFGGDGKLLPALQDVLAWATLGDPWGAADLLTSPQRHLDGRIPIEILKTEPTPDTLQKIINIFRRAYDK